MRLAIIRHAVAEERARFARTGRPDEERPLTADGRRKLQRGLPGLVRWVPEISLLATSPLTRARETLEIVRTVYPRAAIEVWPELSPDGLPPAVLERIQSVRRRAVVAVVSHNPLLPRLISWLLTGDERPIVEARKGSVHLLEWKGTPAAGEALLLGAVPPAVLRAARRSAR